MPNRMTPDPSQGGFHPAALQRDSVFWHYGGGTPVDCITPEKVNEWLGELPSHLSPTSFNSNASSRHSPRRWDRRLERRPSTVSDKSRGRTSLLHPRGDGSHGFGVKGHVQGALRDRQRDWDEVRGKWLRQIAPVIGAKAASLPLPQMTKRKWL